jgi:hypothetical protein
MSAHHRDDYETDEDFLEAVDNDAAIAFHARRYREEGTGTDLLAAAAALRESPLPPDLLADFVRAVWRYQSADAWTLDEAFGVSRPKGKHQQPEKERLSNLDFRLRQEVVHTWSVMPAAMAGVTGFQRIEDPVPRVALGLASGWRRLRCGSTK